MPRKHYGGLDAVGAKVTNVATPTAASDAATKGYVDSATGAPGYVPVSPNIFTFPVPSGAGPEDSIGTGNTDMYYGPTWIAPCAYRITAAKIHLLTVGSGTLAIRLGLVRMDTDDQPLSLAADFGELPGLTTTGEKIISGLSATVTAGLAYSLVVWRTGGFASMAMQAWPVSYGHLGQWPTVINRAIVSRSVLVAGTTFPNPMPDWTTLNGANANARSGPLELVQIKREPI